MDFEERIPGGLLKRPLQRPLARLREQIPGRDIFCILYPGGSLQRRMVGDSVGVS